MGNKILIIILVIVVIALAGFSAYLYTGVAKCKAAAKATATDLGSKLQNCGTGAEQLQAALNQCIEGTKEITSAHLEKFPAGTTMTPGAQGTETTTFKKTDLMALSGEAVVTGTAGKAILTFQILYANGEIVQGGGQGMEIKGSGGFGMCCINVPQTLGTYSLKLFLDGKEVKVISFEVVK